MRPIKRENISDSIVRQMVDLIAQGSYKPGQKLPPERELMQQFAVGRSSVREAFRALALMGLISIRPGQGTFVSQISKELVVGPNLFAPLADPQATQELLEARLVMEPAIAALAAERHTAADIRELEAILDACQGAMEEGEPVYSLSAGFHLLIARASHNTVFIRFMEALINLLAARGSRIEEQGDFLRWELDSHRAVLRSIKAGDARQTRGLMEEHIKASARYYLDLTGEQ